MIESAVAIAIFLIIILIFLKRKKLSSEPEKSVTQESKPIDKATILADEPALQAKKTPESLAPAQQEKTVVTPIEPETTQIPQPSRVVISSDSIPVYKNRKIPQDFMLRRHYIAHLHAMITELNQTYPTDSMLRRHYHAHIATQLDQCLNSEQAMQQLICCYEDHKKTLVRPVQKPQAIITSSPDSKTACEAVTPVTTTTPCKVAKIPEDSMLRRHYLTKLYTQVADRLPARPTDSALRRHYDTMLENEVKKYLCS